MDKLLAGGAVDPAVAWGREEILAAGFEAVDYLDLRLEETLGLAGTLDRPARLFVAAWLGKTRLIDNVKVA